MIRKIIEIGHPALREVAKSVRKADISSKEIQRLVDDLIDTMRYANGAGLAATQIAVPLRVCVIEVKNKSGIDFEIDYLNVYRTNGNKKRKASYQRLQQEGSLECPTHSKVHHSSHRFVDSWR